MSAPAAKALVEPVRTRAPMDGSASSVRRAELSSLKRGVLRALRALGRWSVTGEMERYWLAWKPLFGMYRKRREYNYLGQLLL
jgi:hypothetical protein